MGRAKRHFKGNNSSQDKKRRREHAENWKNTRGGDPQNQWVTVTENRRMEAFYKAMHFVEEGEDWDRFMASLRTTLPATFRICSGYTFAEELKKEVEGFMGHQLSIDGVEIKAIESLSWYPGGNAYKLGTDRRSIRKLEALNHLHKWMIQHTDNGNITRQEAVSMVPPLALDVEPHHKCLDMCASPGSKTSQLLEIVNQSLGRPEDQQGLVVANDVDTDRAYMLVHQCKRINSPLLVITTHAGQFFPSLRTSPSQTSHEFFDRVLCDVPCSGDGTLRKNPMIWGKWCTSMAMSLHTLQISIARRGLQLLKAGGVMVYSTCSMSPYEDEAVVAELLRTHNDLELIDARQFLPLFKARPGLNSWYVLDDHFALKNEIRARRDANKKTGEATDLSAEPNASACTDVKVDEEMEASASSVAATEEAPAPTPADYSHIEDGDLRRCLEMGMQHFATAADVPSHLDGKIRRSFFPPSEEEKAWMHLERSLRCVPQDEDSGGFFVAALRKKATPTVDTSHSTEPARETAAGDADAEKSAQPVPAPLAVPPPSSSAASCSSSGATPTEAAPPVKESDGKVRLSQRGLVEFQPWDQASFEKLRDFYAFDEGITQDCFFIREDQVNKQRKATTGASSKTIYYMPLSVRTLLAADHRQQLKVVTAGIKAFEKKTDGTTGEGDYRLLQDSVQVLAPHIHARKLRVGAQDFSNILGGGLVSFATLSASTVQALYAMSKGMVICIYEYDPADVLEGHTPSANVHTATFHAVCWKGVSKTMNVMCGKIDIEHMKHQLAALHVLRQKILPPKREGEAKEEGADGEAPAGGEEDVPSLEEEAGGQEDMAVVDDDDQSIEDNEAVAEGSDEQDVEDGAA